MQNHQGTIVSVAQTLPAWMGVALGHFVDSITLSNVALIASITYSVVNVYIAIRRKK